MKTSPWLWLVAAALLTGVGCKSTRTSHPPVFTDLNGDDEVLPQSIIVKGNVVHPVLPWTEELTVARAIVQADYVGSRDPLTISIRRKGERMFVDPARLVMGMIDPWLEPGDIVELHTSTQIRAPYDFGHYKAAFTKP